MEVFETNGVFEDVLPAFVPEAPLRVRYGAHEVDGGAGAEAPVLTPAQTRAAPTALACPVADRAALYTLLMVDPDPPSRQNPVYREWLHWIVTDVRAGGDAAGTLDIDGGHEAIAYAGPTPPKGTGLHRYCFILFRQARPLGTLSAKTFVFPLSSHRMFSCFQNTLSHLCVCANSRPQFHTVPFAQKHSLTPVAGCMFLSQH